jgi:hypothetical protein
MSPSKYLAVVALAAGMVPDSWAVQRTILKALQACPNVRDFTDWFDAMQKGDASALCGREALGRLRWQREVRADLHCDCGHAADMGF